MAQHINYYPLIVDGTVYVSIVREGKDGGLAAIDAETGEARTVIKSDAYFWKPTIVDGTVYAALDGSIGAFDLEDGAKRWQTDELFAWPSPPMCVEGTVVTGRGSEVFGFDAATGEQSWNVGNSTPSNYAGRPVIADGMVVQSNLRSVLDVQTGQQRATLPKAISYPMVVEETLFGLGIPDEYPHTRLSIDWDRLQIRWYDPPPENQRGMGGFGSSVDDRYLVVETEEVEKFSIAARRHSTGELLWRTRKLDAYPKFIATGQDTAYVVCSYFPAFAIDIETGKIKWEFTPPTDTARGAGIALAEDLLVISDGVGNLWALE